MRKHLTLKQAAERLGRSVAYLLARIDAGELPAYDGGNGSRRSLRVIDDELEQFAMRRRYIPRQKRAKAAKPKQTLNTVFHMPQRGAS